MRFILMLVLAFAVNPCQDLAQLDESIKWCAHGENQSVIVQYRDGKIERINQHHVNIKLMALNLQQEVYHMTYKPKWQDNTALYTKLWELRNRLKKGESNHDTIRRRDQRKTSSKGTSERQEVSPGTCQKTRLTVHATGTGIVSRVR